MAGLNGGKRSLKQINSEKSRKGAPSFAPSLLQVEEEDDSSEKPKAPKNFWRPKHNTVKTSATSIYRQSVLVQTRAPVKEEEVKAPTDPLTGLTGNKFKEIQHKLAEEWKKKEKENKKKGKK